MNKRKDIYLIGNLINLRSITEEDIPILWKLIYEEDDPEWKKWDAPYFPLQYIDLTAFREKIYKYNQFPVPSRMVIEKDGQLIGTVNYYWEHEPSKWLEIGIVIYFPELWRNGIGTEALKLWIDYLFKNLPIVRIGLTTWSKNERMIKVGYKLGMKLEGRLRKCRFYEGKYYDSIRMGILREEWEEFLRNNPSK
jgi:RimJ/RimL family protein N-acetyltransferase